MLSYLFNRLKEPSTMAGLSMVGYVATHAPSILAAATTPQTAVIGLLGLLAALLPEGSTPVPVKS